MWSNFKYFMCVWLCHCRPYLVLSSWENCPRTVSISPHQCVIIQRQIYWEALSEVAIVAWTIEMVWNELQRRKRKEENEKSEEWTEFRLFMLMSFMKHVAHLWFITACVANWYVCCFYRNFPNKLYWFFDSKNLRQEKCEIVLCVELIVTLSHSNDL